MKKFSISKCFDLVLYLVLFSTILSIIMVSIGNHNLFNNTKYYESISSNYKSPTYYSLSEKKVEIDKTYYTIKEVVPVFKDVGVKFDKSEGILTKPYNLIEYNSVVMMLGVSYLYFILSLIRLYGTSLIGLGDAIRQKGIWGKLFILTICLAVYLTILVFVPFL